MTAKNVHSRQTILDSKQKSYKKTIKKLKIKTEQTYFCHCLGFDVKILHIHFHQSVLIN